MGSNIFGPTGYAEGRGAKVYSEKWFIQLNTINSLVDIAIGWLIIHFFVKCVEMARHLI